MVVYEVSPRDPFLFLWHLISAQVLARDTPFREYANSAGLTEIQDGKRHWKPPANAASLGITESIWMLLKRCWDWELKRSPDSPHVLNILCEVIRLPHAIQTEYERSRHQPDNETEYHASILISRCSADLTSILHRVLRLFEGTNTFGTGFHFP